jgi:hypothetical protein
VAAVGWFIGCSARSGYRLRAQLGPGRRLLTALDVDPERLAASRRVFARRCVDWTHRRPHLAGALPAALTGQFVARGWLLPGAGRELRVTERYDRELDGWLGGCRAG